MIYLADDPKAHSCQPSLNELHSITLVGTDRRNFIGEENVVIEYIWKFIMDSLLGGRKTMLWDAGWHAECLNGQPFCASANWSLQVSLAQDSPVAPQFGRKSVWVDSWQQKRLHALNNLLCLRVLLPIGTQPLSVCKGQHPAQELEIQGHNGIKSFHLALPSKHRYPTHIKY